MPDFGYAIPEQPALDELAQTDLLLDALAGRQAVDLEDPDDDALAALLEDWRDDLRWPPASALVSPEEAVTALHAGLAERRRGHRGLVTIGSVAATLLVLSGFGAVVVEARPGDTLYGLHAMFFDEPRVNENQVMLSAKADLAKVQQLMNKGQWDQAHTELAEVTSMVQSMDDSAGRNDLMDQVNLLNTRIAARDPNATLPPAPPPSSGAVLPNSGNSAVLPAPQTKPAAPSVSSEPSVSAPPVTPKAPSTVAPAPSAPPSASVNPPPSPSPSPSSGKHKHHHGQTPTTDVPNPTP
jgi:Anti-sigma-D factor RsdA to sigma factor binding region